MRRFILLLRLRRFFLWLAFGALSASAGADVVPLPAYNVDIRQTSVSGLSSGGYMAVQFDVAYSSILKGAGIIAGGPYFCAQNNLQTAQGPCMAASSPTNVNQLIQATEQNATAGAVDPTGNLASQRIWLFSGTQDQTVRQAVMNDLQKYYLHYVDNANLFYKNNLGAGHSMPTDFFGNSCSTTADPYIVNCSYDAAGELLKWIYGDLNLPNTQTLSGAFVEFDQRQFIANPGSHSMATSGWAYVPVSCQQGEPCKLHIVFHGCKQYPSYQYFSGAGMVRYGMTYVENTGYNRWADTNNLIVLYPQLTTRSGNPNGCWDWWGYDDSNYAKKNGRQMAAVKAMADRIASPALPAPQNPAVTGATESSVALAWQAVAGAAGYNVYRNNGNITATPVQTVSYTDTGLAAGTSYAYRMRAVDAAGREGAASASVSGKTPGAPPPVPSPTGLSVDNVSATSVSLSWKPVPHVAGYNVFYRTDSTGSRYAQANGSLITAPAYTVGGLAADAAYRFVVRAQNSAQASSGSSNEVTARTAAAVACYTASNFTHVQAGRAHAAKGFALANGSNQSMGLNNTFYVTTLKQTGANFYVIDPLTCP